MMKLGLGLCTVIVMGLSTFTGAAISAPFLDDGNSFSPSSSYAKKQFSSCGAGKSGAFLFVNVEDLKSDEGNVRVHVYGDNPDYFLKGGKGFKVDVKASGGENLVCVPMPKAGSYAVAVMHDINANQKADVFTEGFGFSNNPKLGLSKPEYQSAVLTVPEGVTSITVRMKYLFGADKKKVERRRRMRR